MLRQFQWRIAIPFILLILVFFAGLGLYLEYTLRQSELTRLETQLQMEARLLGEQSAALLASASPTQTLSSQVNRWAGTTGNRVTLIALDGTVLADSEEDASVMENHLDRPEVKQAFQTGEGTSIRFSRTLGENRIYVAQRISQGDRTLGIIRLSMPLTDIQDQLAILGRTILLPTVLAAGLAVLLALVIANRIARPVQLFTETVEEFSGQESAELHVPSSWDELERIGRAFNQIQKQLQRRASETQVERSKLAAVLDQMTDGVIIVDDQGRVQLINPEAEKIFEVTEEDAVDRSVVQVLRNHQIVELWRNCAASGSSQFVYVELATKHLILQGFATQLEKALTGYVLLVFQDITRLRQLETVRRDFISNISHELRTPLASLKALAETLLDGALEDPAAARRFLTSMETEVDALSLMVQELVELSRIESGKVPLHLIATPPRELLDSAVERLSLQAERGGQSLEIDCPVDLPPVLADPPRMEQVIVNLLHNATKYTQPGGKIILSAREESDTILFSVEDTGSGIPIDDLPRIFERFYKADRARSSGGTGLGLAIAKHLVEAHSGLIWAESVEGQGSTFFFSLPLAGKVQNRP